MKNQGLYDDLAEKLHQYQLQTPLPGLPTPAHEHAFILQLCDSVRRIQYIDAIKQRPIDPNRLNPHGAIFDPLRAAIQYMNGGDIDEAFWLTFLFVHFGKNLRSSYRLLRSVYGKLNTTPYWTWGNVVSDIDGFKLWLDTNTGTLRKQGSFGNHRKFQSLKAYSNAGTGATIESYCNLIGNDHPLFLSQIDANTLNDPKQLFDYLFKLFSARIKGFARLAVFDFVTMLGKIGLINVEPRSPYIQKATGPKSGTRLLFATTQASNKELNDFLTDFGNHLNLPFAMQVVEDAVCNWQKSPDNYIQFRG